jgi:hypothetical protein
MGYRKIGLDGYPLDEPRLAAFLDPRTGLMWAAQDVTTKALTFAEAKEACGTFRCAGFDDWRLPTLEELETLRDISRCDPAADPELGLKSAGYWTSDVLASSPRDYAWCVYFFSHGNVHYSSQYSRAFVRAVRGSRASQ